ncbi:MAG TPA: hypothetical protein VGD46_00530 [Rhizobacter sp.]
MSDNPYTARRARAGIGASGRRAERKASTRLGARLTPASGAIASAKGDFAAGDFLCENKSTTNASLSLKLDWLQKISREALPKGKTPALALQFVNADGTPEKAGSWVMIPEHLFKELLDGRD